MSRPQKRVQSQDSMPSNSWHDKATLCQQRHVTETVRSVSLVELAWIVLELAKRSRVRPCSVDPHIPRQLCSVTCQSGGDECEPLSNKMAGYKGKRHRPAASLGEAAGIPHSSQYFPCTATCQAPSAGSSQPPVSLMTTRWDQHLYFIGETEVARTVN